MKVNLYNIQEAEYEIKENKCSKIPFEVFCKMGNIDLAKSSGNVYPSARFFSNIDEFKTVVEKDAIQFDRTKDIYVMPNGKICVLLSKYVDTRPIIIEKMKESNGTTDTEENKG